MGESAEIYERLGKIEQTAARAMIVLYNAQRQLMRGEAATTHVVTVVTTPPSS